MKIQHGSLATLDEVVQRVCGVANLLNCIGGFGVHINCRDKNLVSNQISQRA